MAAAHTTNLNLNKPDRSDFVSVVNDINDNMDMIDAAYGNLDNDKANKVTSPTNGHIATLDGNGDLLDSGKSISDLTPTATQISGKKYRINL